MEPGSQGRAQAPSPSSRRHSVPPLRETPAHPQTHSLTHSPPARAAAWTSASHQLPLPPHPTPPCRLPTKRVPPAPPGGRIQNRPIEMEEGGRGRGEIRLSLPSTSVVPICETRRKGQDAKNPGRALASVDSLYFSLLDLGEIIPYLCFSKPLWGRASGDWACFRHHLQSSLAVVVLGSDSNLPNLDFTPPVLGRFTLDIHLHTPYDPQ